MHRYFIFLVSLISCCYSGLTLSAQTNNTTADMLKFTASVSNLSDYYAEVIGYYLNRPLYVGDFNIHNLKQDINAEIYTIDPKSPAEKESNAQQEYLSVKFNTKIFFDKEELASLISKAEGNTESVKKHCIRLSNYFANKEYVKDPDFTKYPALRDSLQIAITIAQDAWKKVTTYNSDVKNAAETQLIQSYKVAEFVVPMKEDIDKLRKIIAQVYSQDFSAIILKMDVSELRTMTEIHKDFSRKDKTKLKDESYIDVYKRFYASTDECLDIVIQILSCVEQKKFDSELDRLFDKLNSTFNKTEEDYKLFASQK